MGRRYAVLYLMRIELYKFGKKKNSTMRPDAQHAELLDGTFEKGQDICNPVIRIVTSGTLGSYNYAFIHELDDRYFFVNKIVSVAQGVTDLYLEVDPLATYKDEILKQDFYVSRSSSNYDERLIDKLYPTAPGYSYGIKSTDWIQSGYFSPNYIIGVIGKNSTGGNPVNYYIITRSNLNALMQWLFNASNFSTEISDEVVKTFFNPSQYIVSCTKLPFDYTGGGTSGKLSLGWFDTDIDVTVPLRTFMELPTITIEIPQPPGVTAARDFRHFSPYAMYKVYIPYIGMVEIDSQMLIDSTNIRVDGVLDIPTGSIMVKVFANETNILITTLEGNACTPIAIAQNRIDFGVMSASAMITSGISNVIPNSGDWGTFKDALKSVGDAVLASNNQISTKGAQGNQGQQFFITAVLCIGYFRVIVNRDLKDFGAPLLKNVKLNTLTGYCEVINAHFFSTQATEPERDAVNSYLEGGFYIE